MTIVTNILCHYCTVCRNLYLPEIDHDLGAAAQCMLVHAQDCSINDDSFRHLSSSSATIHIYKEVLPKAPAFPCLGNQSRSQSLLPGTNLSVLKIAVRDDHVQYLLLFIVYPDQFMAKVPKPRIGGKKLVNRYLVDKLVIR